MFLAEKVFCLYSEQCLPLKLKTKVKDSLRVTGLRGLWIELWNTMAMFLTHGAGQAFVCSMPWNPPPRIMGVIELSLEYGVSTK